MTAATPMPPTGSTSFPGRTGSWIIDRRAWQFPADQPVFRTDPNSLIAHSQLLAKATQGGIDVYFEGDSITRRWGATDYPELLANWKREFLRLECGRFRLGRRPDAEHPLASGERRAGRRESQSGGAARGDKQRRGCAFPGDADAKAADVTRGLEAIVRHDPGEGSDGDDHRNGHFSQKRQHGFHARDRQDQRQSGAAGGWARRSAI